VRILLIGGGVHPIPPTGYGAIERILAEFEGALRAAGHDAVVVNRVRHRRMRDEYPFAWELPRLLARERFDVLHANTPVVANRLAGRHWPFVYTTHSRHWYFRERLSHRWGYYLERRAVRRATEVVALSPGLARTMSAVVRPPLPPITVIPFGVDPDRFRPAWEQRTGRVALGVGVVAPFKRWDWAARALRGSGMKLRIAGPIAAATYADDVRRAGDEVELLGEVPQDELERLFAESDVLVHPSSVELLSAAVLEGLAAGLPVLGGPTLEGCVVDGTTGSIVPDRDPAEFVRGLSERVRELSQDSARRRAVGEAARADALRRFSWSQVVADHLPIYARVAARSKRPSGGGP
jgi:glycosyltransferase involved in cell wall biosynthesis